MDGHAAHEAPHDLLSAVLLHEREYAVDPDDGHDGGAEFRYARSEGEARSKPQEERERVREVREKRRQQARALRRDGLVRPEHALASPRLDLADPLRRRIEQPQPLGR